ncbi:hypothetical protein X943_003142 [Babesia divergens]|uniref:Uncharacterized protein n=1 Tax=Babesia divergens TaxID=32595 RepID=A0AAD9G5J6_BABDI|nr:hypothetical protein X943_003142 [Babesia divergens]
MPGQSVMPWKDEHEATENLLEGSIISIRLKAHSLFEFLGNLLAIIGAMKIPAGEPPSNEAVGARATNKPLVKILAGVINTIRIPRAPTDLIALSGHIEEQE